jgi:nitrate reductase gamma subunit
LGAILLILGGELVGVAGWRATRQKKNLPLDADHEDQLVLGGHVGVAVLAGDAVEAALLALRIAVLLDVLLGTLEDGLALLLVVLWGTSAAVRTKSAKCACVVCAIRPERR